MSLIFERDIDHSVISGKSIAVVGYGNQGRAHALNLRDRGLDVRVGTREGAGRETAMTDGFETLSISTSIVDADLVVLTVPDETMGSVFDELVAPNLADSATLIFAHGFALTYGLVKPHAGGAVLVSPSGPGTAVRESFVAGSGLPGFVAAEPAVNWPVALGYAWAIGCARGGLIKTTFREETECDLFGEQVVLCGGMPELAIAAFETLVDAGYSPEVAYTECVQQVRLLADLMAKHGVAGMKARISDTAEWGSYLIGPRIIGQTVRDEMESALAHIKSGEFARDWIAESDEGKSRLYALRAQARSRKHEETFVVLKTL